MKTSVFLLTLLLLCCVSARGKEFQLPVDKPVVRLSVSDDWKPASTPRGLLAQTQDGTVFLTVGVTADTKEMSAIIDESDAMLKARKIKLDRTSRRDNKFKINGFPSEEIAYTGLGPNGEKVTVSFTFVTIGETALEFTYRATAQGNYEHQGELGQIFDSIKGIKTVPSQPSADDPAADRGRH